MFVPGRPFQSNILSACKASALPSEMYFRCSTLGQAPNHTHKHQTRQLSLAREKHSSLLRILINYSCKKFGLHYKTFYDRNLCIFIISQSVCPWQAYPSDAPFRCSTLGQAPGLTHKHQTRLESLDRDKHSSLLLTFVNYGCKKFWAPGDVFKKLLKIYFRSYLFHTYLHRSQRLEPLT